VVGVNTPDPPPEIEDLRGLARSLRLLFEFGTRALLEDSGPSELALRVTGHLGCELAEIVSVSEKFALWELVNVQRGVDAYLRAQRREADWFGAPGTGRQHHEDMLSMISAPSSHFSAAGAMGSRRSRAVTAGTGGTWAASYGTAAIGPEKNTEVVTSGLVIAAAPDGAPVVIGVRDDSQFGPPSARLEILAADRAAAAATRDEIERLMRVHDVFRGQVLSFTQNEHHGNGLVSFLPRPAIAAQDVVLPGGVLESIEQHIIGVAEWSRELLSAGQHLKRGLLLHGPPGTGKTHTVRYLTARLTSSTVILLTGHSIRFIEAAAALARRLQPSMVVLEDVDLVATDRDYTPDGNPLLFSLLDAMDGIGADADVTFVLTTNRADILETALRRLPRAAVPPLRPRPGPGRRPGTGSGRHGRSHRFLRQGDDQADRPGLAAGRRASAGAARRPLRRGPGRDERAAPGPDPVSARSRRRPGRGGRSGSRRPPGPAGPSAPARFGPLPPLPVGQPGEWQPARRERHGADLARLVTGPPTGAGRGSGRVRGRGRRAHREADRILLASL
jgi:ATPase family associated with various cellular activities (AAA)